MRGFILATMLLAWGCRAGKDALETDTIDSEGLSETPDADGDGYTADEDCDDNNSLVNPGAAELCDGFDNNCDGTVDEGVTTTFYADTDGDGFGDPDAGIEACEQPDGYVPIGNDCDDTTAENFPGAGERCDGEDNDCDGEIDEDLLEEWYLDSDGDGYGDPAVVTDSCDPGPDYVADSTDCDDTTDVANPGAAEVCDTVDNDCDGDIDEDVTTTFYADTDGDSYGVSDKTTDACEAPTGWSDTPGDCDDADANISPDAEEVCNQIDDDCDTFVDEGVTTTYYADTDGDGYGDAASTADACAQPSGYTSDATDCDDTDADVSPGDTEVCNEVDDDCDGDTDEGVTTTYYADDDRDGYGDVTETTEACAEPSGYTDDDADCDDDNADISPDGEEVCNGDDDDCDGSIDEGSADPETFYADDDGDGFGDASSSTEACDVPSGYTDDDTDCDDADADINPSASEACNGEDDDCDGTTDNGVLGTGADCAADSCLDILGDDSTAADGDYWVWFNTTETETTCDMTTDGGGWTLIFEDDFESTPDSGWSLSSRYTCGSWSTLLGGYGIIANGEIDITVSTHSISHTEAWVELEYMALDSWDGETAYVDFDGGTVWSQGQNNHSTSYSEVCGWDRGYEGSYDSKHDVSEIVAHSGGSIELIGGSTLNQASTDESFGLDDVDIWIR